MSEESVYKAKILAALVKWQSRAKVSNQVDVQVAPN